MPFGCFGKRRKREKPDGLAEKNADTAADGGDATGDNAVGEVTKLPNSNSDDVSEVIAVARHHSLHASAPSSVEHRHTTIGIQKSATLARYDFLRKSEYANTADRWVALKKQYLTPTMTNSQSQHHHAASGGQNGSVKRAAQSLPRQFAPPTLTGGDRTPVRFSQWFYERQTKEAIARQEFHEREEKNRKLLDGLDPPPIVEEAASATVDVAADDDISGRSENAIEASYKPEDAPAGTTVALAATTSSEQEPTAETAEADDDEQSANNAGDDAGTHDDDDDNPLATNSTDDDTAAMVVKDPEIEGDRVRDDGDLNTVDEKHEASENVQSVAETD